MQILFYKYLTAAILAVLITTIPNPNFQLRH